MNAFFVSSNEWLYPDVFRYTSQSPEAALHAARGGYAAVQLFLDGAQLGDTLEITCGGNLPQPERYRLKDVRCQYNTNAYGADTFAADPGTDTSAWTTRLAPFRVFDALMPFSQGGDTADGAVTALYLAFPIPADMQPGVYCGPLTVRCGGQARELTLSITVHQVRIPQKGRLSITNWCDPSNMASRYGLELGSEAWMEMMRRLMRLMRRTRQTHYLVSLSLITVTEPVSGQYAFDFSRMERFIRMVLEEGFTTLELGHIFGKNYVTNEAYYLFYRPKGRIIYGDTPEGYHFLSQFLPQWAAFLREHGWYDCAVQHLGDEPSSNMVDNYRILAGVVRKFMPGMKIFDAVVHPELRGAVDYFIPLNSDYETQRDAFETLRAEGDTLWFYTACGPGGRYLNRMLDLELLRTRLLHWGNFRYDLTGYLHWGFNCWQQDQPDVYEYANAVINDGHTLLPPGDTHICYPGNAAGPWMSLRAEQMRSGAEDCELLYLLKDRDAAQAQRLLDHVMRSFTDYETDPIAFDRAYEALLTALDS